MCRERTSGSPQDGGLVRMPPTDRPIRSGPARLADAAARRASSFPDEPPDGGSIDRVAAVALSGVFASSSCRRSATARSSSGTASPAPDAQQEPTEAAGARIAFVRGELRRAALKVLGRLVATVHREQALGEVEADLRRRRIELGDGFELQMGLLDRRGPHRDLAKLPVRVDVRGLEFQRAAELLCGFGKPAKPHEQIAEIEHRVHIAGIVSSRQ